MVTAGILEKGALAEMDEATIDRLLHVNFVGPVTVARKSLPYLQQTKGQLLLYTSSSYTRGRAGYALYSSTKAALVNLTQALADEWAEIERTGQLHQPGADRHPDADAGLRRGAGAHPARRRGRRPGLAGRADLAT